MRGKRIAPTPALRREVLIEAGYRCAVPTCRTILAIDLHHIIEVEEGGPTELSNLLALCPTCHALYTRGTISREAINVWKTTLVALNHAFDQESISLLHFLKKAMEKQIAISGDGVLRFAHLIASGLAEYYPVGVSPMGQVLYNVRLTQKGTRIIDAWFAGNREQVKEALIGIINEAAAPTDES
jgi:hypothetical protein